MKTAYPGFNYSSNGRSGPPRRWSFFSLSCFGAMAGTLPAKLLCKDPTSDFTGRGSIGRSSNSNSRMWEGRKGEACLSGPRPTNVNHSDQQVTFLNFIQHALGLTARALILFASQSLGMSNRENPISSSKSRICRLNAVGRHEVAQRLW
jgi:hypothetical protein